MKDHIHTFAGEFHVKRITKVQKDYSGTAGDKAFIVRDCECKQKVRAIDYGSYKEMQVKLTQLQEKES